MGRRKKSFSLIETFLKCIHHVWSMMFLKCIHHVWSMMFLKRTAAVAAVPITPTNIVAVIAYLVIGLVYNKCPIVCHHPRIIIVSD